MGTRLVTPSRVADHRHQAQVTVVTCGLMGAGLLGWQWHFLQGTSQPLAQRACISCEFWPNGSLCRSVDSCWVLDSRIVRPSCE